MMTSLYVSLKSKMLRFFGTTFLSSFILNSLVFLVQDDRSFWDWIATASLTSLVFTLIFMGIIHQWNPMQGYRLLIDFSRRDGEKTLKWAKVGYILHGQQPIQGELLLTNQRLLFRYLQEEPPVGTKQLEADREEIREVALSATNSKYRTGITVKVKDGEHIFTVAMPDRWVADIRNVVMHGYTAN